MKVFTARAVTLILVFALIGMIVFSLSSFARAQEFPAVPPVNPVTAAPLTDWKALFTPQTWAVLLGIASTILTVPITALLKNLLGTEGVSSVTVNAIVNAFFAGLLPYFANLYSLPYAIVASILGIVMDKFTHLSLQSIAQNAVKP
jgi:hypothetical protein